MLDDVGINGVVWLLAQFFLQVTGQTWHKYEGHCYAILNVKSDFNSCKASCQQYGSHVVELEDEPELHFIQTLISNSHEQYWVGLDYINAAKKFIWHTNRTEPTPAMWLPTEPNDTGFCVRLATEAQTGANVRGTRYLLGDHPCTNDYKVICEKNSDLLQTVHYRDMMVSPTNRCSMTSYTTRSRLGCARNCSKNESCTGFEFNMPTRMCTPYMFSSNCTTPLTASVSMYVMYARC